MDMNVELWGSEFIEANEPKPCAICGKPTRLVEIFYEMRYCSEECLREEDRRYKEWCDAHPMLEEEF